MWLFSGEPVLSHTTSSPNVPWQNNEGAQGGELKHTHIPEIIIAHTHSNTPKDLNTPRGLSHGP